MTSKRIQLPGLIVALMIVASLASVGCGNGDDGGNGAAVAITSTPSRSAAPAATPTVPPTRTATPAEECPPPELPPGVVLGDAVPMYTDDCRAFVRTPDEFFENLPDFPFEPRYVTVDGLRIHYVDEGPADGEVVLMMHGQPSWSYLYRKMIPIIADAGYRAIAVDMIGMGRSDKPVALGDYRYLQHVAWIEEFLDAAGLDDITLFCQDWGSLVGLRVVGDLPDRFARVVVANGRLPVISSDIDLRSLFTVPDPPTLNPDAPFTLGSCEATQNVCFSQWIAYSLTNPGFRPSQVIPVAAATDLTEEELAAYDAPFPSLVYMAGVRTFPSLIVTLNEEPTNEAARAVFDAWEKPLLTLFGRLDMNLGSEAVQAELRDTVPGAQGQPHHAYEDASHFIQEDKGEDLAYRVVDFMRTNPIEPEDPIERIIELIVANGPSYGEVNADELRRILTIEDDRPFYMFNLIRYREHALYPDGSNANLTGRQADARYEEAALPILESFGARVAFAADVEESLIGGDEWDRVAIARYASRAAFFSMIQSPAFQAASIHKEAGVERSIVIVTEDVSITLPPELAFDPGSVPFPPTEDDPVRAVVHLIRYNDVAQYPDGRPTSLTGREAMELYQAATAPRALPLGIRPALNLEIEGVFVGDGRQWDEARVNLFPSRETFDQLNAQPGREEDLQHRLAAIDETYALMTIPVIGP